MKGNLTSIDEVKAEIKEAIQFGMESPLPNPDEFLRKIDERYAI